MHLSDHTIRISGGQRTVLVSDGEAPEINPGQNSPE